MPAVHNSGTPQTLNRLNHFFHFILSPRFSQILNLCAPGGLKVHVVGDTDVAGTAENAVPPVRQHTMIMTKEDGCMSYGHVLTFFERCDDELLTQRVLGEQWQFCAHFLSLASVLSNCSAEKHCDVLAVYLYFKQLKADFVLRCLRTISCLDFLFALKLQLIFE